MAQLKATTINGNLTIGSNYIATSGGGLKVSDSTSGHKNFTLYSTATSGSFDLNHLDVATITASGQIQATSFYATSDIRLKENIVDYIPKESILNLPIKEFDFKESKEHTIGCIAQDLQKICPEIVKEREDGYLTIEESKIVYLLLDEVKKLKAEVEELKEKIYEN